MASDAPMRLAVFIAATTLCSSIAAPALAADRCEDAAARLVDALGHLPGSATLKVTHTPERTTLVDVISKRTIADASCDGLRITLPETLVRPERGTDPARTRVDGPYTISVTARGVVSLSIAAGVAGPEAMEIVSFDDDSVAITDAKNRTWYSLTHRADGTRIEVQGKHVGCGCELTTRPDGQRATRPL